MKRTAIIFLLLVSSVVAIHAQTSFRDAVIAYVKACPSATEGMTEPMKNALSLVNEKLIKDYDERRADALTKKYVDGPFLGHVVDHIMVPLLEKKVSVSDLQSVTKLMLTNEGKQFQEHQKRMNVVGVKQMEQKTVDVMQGILAGSTPQKEQPRKDIPQAYRQLYYKFYDAAKLDDVIAPMMTMIKQTADASQQEAVGKFQQYLTENMKVIYLNMSYEYMTTGDLNFGLKAYGSASYHNIMGAIKDMPTVAQSGGMALVMAYLEWLKEQGVELKM